MILANVLSLIGVFAAYIFLFALLPFWLKGRSGASVLDDLVMSFLFGHVIVIFIVLTLSLMGILNRISIITSLAAIGLIYRFTIKRRQTLALLDTAGDMLDNISTGHYRLPLLFERFLRRIKPKFPAALIFTLAIFAFAIYRKSYHAIASMPFVTTTTIDIYTHVEWTAFLMQNAPFHNGVYPFGFHSTIAALSLIFPLNPITVFRMFGAVSGTMIVFALYFLLRRVLKSAFAINAALALYVATDLFHFHATWRMIMALPQEYALIFLYFAGYFLFRFMRDKQTIHLMAFAAAISIIFSTHSLIFIFAFLICTAIFCASLMHLNRKTLLRLIAAAACALAISAAPMAAGLFSGIPLEASFGWGFGLIRDGTDELTQRVNLQTGEIMLPMEFASFREFLREYTRPGGEYIGWLNPQWFLPYLAGAALAVIYPLYNFLRRKNPENMVLAGLSAYSLAVLALYMLAAMQIFSISEDIRIYMLLVYSAPIVICMPIEILHNFCHAGKRRLRMAYLCGMAAFATTGAAYTLAQNRIMPKDKIFQMQHNGAILAFYDIARNHPPNSWTIISPIFEYSMSLFSGFHYNLSNFAIRLANYQPGNEIFIPTDYVFVFIEKRPIRWYQHSPAFADLRPADLDFDINAARAGLDDWQLSGLYADYETHRSLNARALAWARLYIQYFPNEMAVFFEDENIVVYKLRQNAHLPNNLAIRVAS
ncbi:MAG: hypothetical protein FWB71_03930 [Defluviitaleaceae bacterium]|nr:hypothetical protein [Defluviitaleaceae bacterium]